MSSIVFSFADDFTLKFKKKSEKLKYYEGENIVKIANEANANEPFFRTRERDDRSLN